MHINPRVKISSAENQFLHLKKQKKLLPILSAVLAALMLALLTGCTLSKEAPRKVKDVDYSIVEEQDIPEKLKEAIEEKKAAEFKISFEDEENMYFVHCYGEHETGGYSIMIRDLYLTENALYFDTELLGPENGSNPQKKPSYPYIVVKTKKYKQNIVFE